MRCFISIEMPEEIKQEMLKIQKQLPEFNGKLTEKENLHLTLKFLGEIEEEKVREVKKKLKEIKFNSFNAVLDEIGVFSPQFIKIIWMHIAGREVMELQKQIDDILKNLFAPENRFQSHVTIARVKSCDKKKFSEKLPKIKLNKISFKVSKVYLMKSTLTEEKPIYEIIEEFSSLN